MFLNKFFKNHLTIPQATELFEEVKSQTHPDITNLKRLVEIHKAPVGTKEEMQALNLKYRAMTHIPTTIEKTMSPAQLYDTNCPLWCAKYNIHQLSYYFMLDNSAHNGQGIIKFMENSVIPHIKAPSTIIPNKPLKKGTVKLHQVNHFHRKKFTCDQSKSKKIKIRKYITKNQI